MLSAVLVILLAAQQPATPAPPSAEDVGRAYYEFLQARALESDNDVSGALASYHEAIQRLPRSAALRIELAGLHVRLNQMPAAEHEVREALTIESDNREAHLLLGGILASRLEGQPDGAEADSLLADAIDHLEQGVSGEAVDGSVALVLGRLYLRRGDTERALERLGAVAEGRNYPMALRLTALAHEMAGRSQEAAAALATLRTLRPDQIDQVEAFARHADRLERAGQWADAATRWSEIVAFDPSASIYRTRQAAALAAAGRLEDARAVLRVTTREMPKSVRAWYLSALIEGQARNAEGVEAAVARIREIDPDDGRAQVALARARAVSGDPRGVVELLEARVRRPQASDISSGLIVEMAGLLSGAYETLEQPDRAVRALETAHKHAPANQQLLFSLAAAYEENRRYDRAERTFRELIAANDAHAPALNYLGYMLADRGEKLPEAVELIKRALALDEDNPAYLDSLGWAYFRLGQFDEAREPLERAARALPKASVINDHLGDLYLRLQRYDEAVAAFERALAGDRDGLDADAVERKRNRARELAGKS